jgi:hypothetical protein
MRPLLSDERLYCDNQYALDALEEGLDLNASGYKNQVASDVINTFHCYWFGVFGRKQEFSIKSFLCTQNLKYNKVVLWLDIDNGFGDYRNNIHLQNIAKFIEIRAYDPKIQVENTPWAEHVNLATYTNGYDDLVKRGDAFRFLILYKYGGSYFDLDVMFLKEVSGLLHNQFCYAWERQPFANSAICNLTTKSDIAEYLLHKCIEKQQVSPWHIFRYEDEGLKELYVLPCAFFDPIWQGVQKDRVALDYFGDFFRKFDHRFSNKLNIQSYKEFFPGGYTYHWHNE